MTKEQIIAAAKEAGFAEWENTDSPEFLAVIAEFYTIAFNDGFRSFSDELCEKCGKTRQHAGGGCIHCITEWCKEKVQEANAERDEIHAAFNRLQGRLEAMAVAEILSNERVFKADSEREEWKEASLINEKMRIELRQQLAGLSNRVKDECAALCYEQNWELRGEEMAEMILATKEEVK